MAKLYLQSGDEWDKDLREDISLHSRRLQRKTRSASLSWKMSTLITKSTVLQKTEDKEVLWVFLTR